MAYWKGIWAPLSRYANPNKQHNKSVITADNPGMEVTRKQKTEKNSTNSKEENKYWDPISIRLYLHWNLCSGRRHTRARFAKIKSGECVRPVIY